MVGVLLNWCIPVSLWMQSLTGMNILSDSWCSVLAGFWVNHTLQGVLLSWTVCIPRNYGVCVCLCVCSMLAGFWVNHTLLCYAVWVCVCVSRSHLRAKGVLCWELEDGLWDCWQLVSESERKNTVIPRLLATANTVISWLLNAANTVMSRLLAAANTVVSRLLNAANTYGAPFVKCRTF